MPRILGFKSDTQRERFLEARALYACGGPLARECGAKLRTGGVCTQLALAGETRCLRHGGPAVARRFRERQLRGFENGSVSAEEAPFETLTLDTFDRMIATHLRAFFVLSQAVLPGMRRRGFGRIIAVTSQLAYKGAPGLVHYSAAKAGLTGFVRALSQEVARDGVLVNAIAPGPVNTRLSDDLTEEWKAWKRAQLPIGRFGSPEEIAPTAVLLASDEGSFYVGQTLSPNGGDIML